MAGGADQALAVAPPASAIAPDPHGVPNINPATGLSTDYLNHFTEAVMVLEMLTVMPDCLPDLQAWEPKTYCEHFAASRFTSRSAVIAHYRAANPRVRRDLDNTAEILNAALRKTRDTVVAQFGAPVAAEIAKGAAARLKPLIATAAAIINGTATGPDQDRQSTQAAIDALFGR